MTKWWGPNIISNFFCERLRFIPWTHYLCIFHTPIPYKKLSFPSFSSAGLPVPRAPLPVRRRAPACVCRRLPGEGRRRGRVPAGRTVRAPGLRAEGARGKGEWGEKTHFWHFSPPKKRIFIVWKASGKIKSIIRTGEMWQKVLFFTGVF